MGAPLGTALKITLDSVIFGLIIALLTYFSWDTITPSILLSSGCLLSPFIVLMSNIKSNKRINSLNDSETLMAIEKSK